MNANGFFSKVQWETIKCNDQWFGSGEHRRWLSGNGCNPLKWI